VYGYFFEKNSFSEVFFIFALLCPSAVVDATARRRKGTSLIENCLKHIDLFLSRYLALFFRCKVKGSRSTARPMSSCLENSPTLRVVIFWQALRSSAFLPHFMKHRKKQSDSENKINNV